MQRGSYDAKPFGASSDVTQAALKPAEPVPVEPTLTREQARATRQLSQDGLMGAYPTIQGLPVPPRLWRFAQPLQTFGHAPSPPLHAAMGFAPSAGAATALRRWDPGEGEGTLA